MDTLSKAVRFGTVAAVAIMLTFCRGALLSVVDKVTLMDSAMSYFVLGMGPLSVFYWMARTHGRSSSLVWPIGLLVVWVCFCVLFLTPRDEWPDRTSVINLALVLALAPQISRQDLRLLRYCILGLAALFSVVVLTQAPDVLNTALTSSEGVRMGADVSPANVIVMPRVYFTLALTCLATALIEKRIWLRIVPLPLMVIPVALGFAGGSRGPLLGLTAALMVFAFGVWKRIGKVGSAVFIAVIAVSGYWAVQTVFPVIARRMTLDDTKRSEFYQYTIEDIFRNVSLLGNGISPDYPHNIFLEFLNDYGIVGLCLFLLFLGMSIRILWRVYRATNDMEVVWAAGIMALLFMAQQLSLSLFTGSLWAALLLPAGLASSQGKSRLGAALRRPRVTANALGAPEGIQNSSVQLSAPGQRVPTSELQATLAIH